MHLGAWFLDVPGGRKKIQALSGEGLSLDVAHDGKEFMV